MTTTIVETQLTDLPALEIARLIRERTISPVEVTRAFLERIERITPLINAYVTVTAELALTEATAAERALPRRNRRPCGPLHGVPVSIKDLTATAGTRTTYGSSAFADHVPTEDAEIIVRLRKAGAIMLGKTTTPELGVHWTTEECIGGPTRNPWNLEYSSGGSRGGAAAAVAARLGSLADGSDAGDRFGAGFGLPCGRVETGTGARHRGAVRQCPPGRSRHLWSNSPRRR